jgi:polyisoprenyl-phosphate glycosyltransferase
MIEKWREGLMWSMLFARNARRILVQKTTASLFYRIIYRITDVDIPLDTGDFR